MGRNRSMSPAVAETQERRKKMTEAKSIATACIAIATTTHGKWCYKTAVRYLAGSRKDGSPCWLKDRVLAEATTSAKIRRLAEQAAAEQDLPLLPGVRHFSPR